LFLLVLILAIIEVAHILPGHRQVAAFSGIWWLLICLIQWMMIVPHELGHAVAGKLLGYTQIRIMVGAGKPFLSFELAGFYWIINPIPFGGLTYSASPGRLHRWKHLVFVCGGLLVNLFIGGIAWCFIGAGELFSQSGNLAKLVFWANLIIVVQNVIPWVARTSVGPIPNDGLQIWQILFQWNKPPKQPSTRVPYWEIFVCYVLKWFILLVVVSVTLFLGFAVTIPFTRPFPGMAPMTIPGILLWLAIFLPLTAVCGWYCFRVYDQPIARIRKPTNLDSNASLIARYRAVFNQEQLELCAQMGKLFMAGHFADAAMLLERIIPVVGDHKSEVYLDLLTTKLHCLLSQNQIDQAERLCLDYVHQEVGVEHKVKILDGIASDILYHSDSASLLRGEKFARMAMEIAPGTLTLKGTLGSILVEEGNYAQGEPLLRECLDRSPALHDRAIASFYLGVIKMRTGEVKEGQRLIKRGMKMYPEAWIVAKGNALLKEARA
jgi:tetratricopeptide (TPR) repeat protein